MLYTHEAKTKVCVHIDPQYIQMEMAKACKQNNIPSEGVFYVSLSEGQVHFTNRCDEEKIFVNFKANSQGRKI